MVVHIQKKRQYNPRFVVGLTMVVVGVISLFVVRAAVVSTSVQPEGGSRSTNAQLQSDNLASGGSAVKFSASELVCGKQVPNYTYQVPFGNAIWNQPICGKPRHPQSTDYANRLYQWGHENDGSTAYDVFNGKIRNDPGYRKAPTFNDLTGLGGAFTREVYYASDSNTERKIFAALEIPSNLDGDDNRKVNPDTPIPWNEEWLASQGEDNELIVLEDRDNSDIPPGLAPQGSIYYLSGFYPNRPLPWRIMPSRCYLEIARNRLCTYNTTVARDLNGNYVDYRTYEGYVSDRGVGLSFLATLTLPEEVKAGEIRHALGLAIPNPAYGPICASWQLGNPLEEGQKCGTAVAPATKFEQSARNTLKHIRDDFEPLYTLDKTIPEGMLFALDMSYTQIDNWVNSRTDLNATRKNTARVFARALKDYGMMIVDTTGGSPSIQTAGGINPRNAAKWTELGMGPTEKDNLLDGLITASNLYVVNPPLATCKNGDISRYYCQWASIKY
jgi:hypothetical protein